jgi:hypothetical protein
MKYEKFIDELKSLGFTIPEAEKKSKANYCQCRDGLQYGGLVMYSQYHYSETCKCEPALVLSWHTGGISGGSCWDEGESRHHAYSCGDPEPDWEDLDRILEHFCPNHALEVQRYHASGNNG